MPLPPLLQKRANALQRQILSASVLQELELFLKKQLGQKSDGRRLRFTTEENILRQDNFVIQSINNLDKDVDLFRFFDQNENIRLEEKFQLEDLRFLEEFFANHNLKLDETTESTETTRKFSLKRQKQKKAQQPVGNLTLQEFQNVLSDLFGSEHWDDHMELLFNKVDTSCDGFVDWDEFCTYMLLQYKEKDYMVTKTMTFLGQPIMRLCTRNKQEPTIRILAISYPPPLWFVSISRGGILTAWDSALNPQKSYEIPHEFKDLQAGKRRFKSWTTDAIYLPNVHKIAMATTSRDIHFFDVTTMNIFEEFHLFGLNHVPTSFCYWYNTKSPGNRSLLLWGDDNGAVNLLWLLKPHSGVFEKPFSQQLGPQKIYMQEMKNHSKLLSYQTIPDVHQEAITKLMYVQGQDLIITSSGSPYSSVVIMDINRRGKIYTWKTDKGVQCFDYCKSLNLLVTGGLDHKVRLWNQYVPSRPIAVLPEHNMAVLDVLIYEPLKQIFSYSKDSVLKVWDISSHTCLQTLVLKFPCVQPGRVQEQGNFPFLMVQPSPHRLLVSYADYIGMLRLAQVDLGKDTLFTHEAPLSGVLYNTFFHQVVTASEDSTIYVWDVETGTKSLLLNNAHGQEEITCMAFDKSQRKLITGARNGTIKIWNVQNGHNLHKLQPVEEAEVTCILQLKEQTFLSVGWNRKIVVYDVTKMQNTYVPANDSWRGGHLHQEDILTADFCPSLGLLATASYDGEIIVWNTETQRIYIYLRRCHRPRESSNHLRRSPGRRNEELLLPISKERYKRQNCESGVSPPVDKVLFLQQRSTLKDAAILISSEAGTLRWWSVFAHQKNFGYFYATSTTDESIFGLSSNHDNTILVSGDTSGCIQVWDISDYGMQAKDKEQEQKPPLLFSWKAHGSKVLSVECLLFDAEPFVISGSSDRTAKLWTLAGKYVGTFGQSKSWNIRNPATYQHCITGDADVKAEGQRNRGDSRTQIKLQVMDENKSSQMEHGEERRHGTRWEEREEKVHLDPSQGMGNISEKQCEITSQALLGKCIEEELTKKAAAKKERRNLNSYIDVGKFNRFGILCSPFQALSTMEVQEVSLPRNLTLRKESVSTTGPETLDWKPGENLEETKTQERKVSRTLQVNVSGLPPLN
ncbi:cilia- and flagella-associated protein 337-like [Discoglossus pictus]